MTNLIYLPVTIAIYIAAQKLQQRLNLALLNPVLITISLLVAWLLLADISYQDYHRYTHWLSYLLQPAVVALGVPLYQQLHKIKAELPHIALVVAVAALIAISSTVLLALIMGASPHIAASLAAKSVTTPVAVTISQHIQGQAAITAIAVIITGLVGAVVGRPWLQLLGITHAKAQGIAMGTACHALGTAKIAESGSQQGAYSALAMVLSAVFSALLCPILVPIISANH